MSNRVSLPVQELARTYQWLINVPGECVGSGRYYSGPAALVGIRNGGREGIRTPGLLIANGESLKLRRVATIS